VSSFSLGRDPRSPRIKLPHPGDEFNETAEPPSNSRLGERLSPERDAPLLKTIPPSCVRCALKPHKTHASSRLGEAHSPKRDGLSPKTKLPCLSEMLEQSLKLKPCNSRLGESSLLERELQAWALVYAHNSNNRTQNTLQFHTIHSEQFH